MRYCETTGCGHVAEYVTAEGLSACHVHDDRAEGAEWNDVVRLYGTDAAVRRLLSREAAERGGALLRAQERRARDLAFGQ